MAFRLFTVPIRDPEPAQEELNSFLQSHKVLSIDRRWVDQGANSFWSFCVDYLSSELSLDLKLTILNRTSHGMDFLGCRLYDNRTTLNRRSRVRFRRKLLQLERDFLDGRIDELDLQQRATSLFAFARAARVSSWRFRRRVLQLVAVSGQVARTG